MAKSHSITNQRALKKEKKMILSITLNLDLILRHEGGITRVNCESKSTDIVGYTFSKNMIQKVFSRHDSQSFSQDLLI